MFHVQKFHVVNHGGFQIEVPVELARENVEVLLKLTQP